MPGPDRPRLVRVAGRDAWHIYHQRRRLTTGCADRTAAEAVLARYLAELDRPTSREVTLSAAAILARYLDDRREIEVPGLDRIGWAHKPLARHFGARPPEVVGDAECKAYARSRRLDGVTDGTIRTELQALRAALRWAARKGMIPAPPEVWMPARPDARARWLTRAEADRLLAGAERHHVKLFIAIGLNTASRAAAILGLTWDRVDLVERRIDFRDPSRAKTRKRRSLVPINDTLLPALIAAKAAATCAYVIEWAGGPVASVKHGIRSAAQRAGVHGVSPHVLRHTAATWMVQAGRPLWEVAGMLGTTVQMVEEVYGHHHPDHLKGAAKALERQS